MTEMQIRKRIAKCATLFGFIYNKKEGNVDPYSPSEFLLYFDGNELTVHSIDEVMDTAFFDGKSLREITNDIIITDW